ncbi:MAG: hypothetical protein ACK5VE_06535 [Alphaproteobacteria bacterium]|jgi:hypothetical protein
MTRVEAVVAGLALMAALILIADLCVAAYDNLARWCEEHDVE